MPEGPELRIAANFINQVASKHLFTGKVIKSDLATKLCEVPFEVKLLFKMLELSCCNKRNLVLDLVRFSVPNICMSLIITGRNLLPSS